MEKRVTVYDIARNLGISTSTVSRVLNNSVLIGEEKRLLILRTAEEMGYRKRLIRRPGSRTILTLHLFLPWRGENEMNLFYSVGDLAAGIQQGFGDVRANLVLRLPEEGSGIFDNKKLGDIDGCIFAFSEPDPSVRGLLDERGIPWLLLNREREGENCAAYDNRAGMLTLLSKLCEARRVRRICYIGYPSVRYTSDARARAVAEGCEERGIRCGSDDLIELSSLSQIDGGLLDLLRRRDYDGVMCFNDVTAVRLLEQARRSGIPVPEAFALTGFDDSPIQNLMSLRIDTIRLSARRLGREAGLWLRRRIVEREEGRLHRLIRGDYVKGDTL